MEWINILNELPKLNTEVLITNGTMYYIAELEKSGYWKDIRNNFHFPTHWMSLPELPK